MGVVRRQTLVALAAGEITVDEAESVLLRLPPQELAVGGNEPSQAAEVREFDDDAGAAGVPGGTAVPAVPLEPTARAAAWPRQSLWPNGKMVFKGGVHGELLIDSRGRHVVLDGRPVELTRREFNVLEVLADRAGTVVLTDDLLDLAWQGASTRPSRPSAVEHVRRVRNGLSDDPREPNWIHAVRGVGYRFSGEPVQDDPPTLLLR